MLSRLANASKRQFSTQVASMTQPGVSYDIPNKLLINGEWRDAKDGQTFDVVNPATGEKITQVA